MLHKIFIKASEKKITATTSDAVAATLKSNKWIFVAEVTAMNIKFRNDNPELSFTYVSSKDVVKALKQ